MEVFQGKSIFKGVAIGPLLYYGKKETTVRREKIEDTEAEVARYKEAREKSVAQLRQLHDDSVKKVGEENAAIFDVHAMLMEDEDFCEAIENAIRTQNVNAEYAVAVAGENFSKMFAEMEDEYFKARSADMKDISERLIRVLTGEDEMHSFEEPSIIIADDLMPSETVQLDKEKVLAFVTRLGSSNSHTAILARTMNIPALIDIPIREDWNGKLAAVDGHTGTFYLDPDEETLHEMEEKRDRDLEARRLLQELKGKKNISLDGKEINLYANIGGLKDVAAVLSNDGGGVGLFRSEFLYIGRDSLPTEEEQFQAYKAVVETMAGKRVIIRTLDIGADKKADYLELEKEDNPALGYRAIRICLTRPDIFKTQLRAIFRASAFGKVAIMYPMITSVEELDKIHTIVAEVKKELTADKIPFKDDVEEGVMIETPAAALISDDLARKVDFFSIGTNDLTQYTLAMDRQNSRLDVFYNPHHKAILRLIRMTIENGHKGGAWVGICGELGADTTLTETFLRMGVDELSVSPSMILPVRDAIRKSHAYPEKE
ncbi:phosphoenolpyruvate--protein phosphotransferase [Bilifractor porci]|uniref:Phosphoenolpyruvate-protein phosphotransferase n=1 Tax=Bilifractor porci TaxID=2606636 RepID=A0A7X2TNJ6_9FIRM|nr:phosphoenolpyruvate--protein phosphotransferase [Bilifractor porci]